MKATLDELRKLPSRKLRVNFSRLDGTGKLRWLTMATAIECIITAKGIGTISRREMEEYWEAILKEGAVVETTNYRYVWDFEAGAI